MHDDSAKIIKPRALTVKQLKFVANKAKGMTGVAAAQDAYGKSYTVSNAIAHENINKPSIIEAVNAEFEKQGITLARIIAPIDRGLDATRVVITGKDEDAFAELQPDYSVQLKASAMAAQFLGFNKQQEGTTNINFIGIADTHKDKFGL